jgi:hypothetical protein
MLSGFFFTDNVLGSLVLAQTEEGRCRISPAAVHSVNLTSATSFGFTQVVTASSLTRCLNGERSVRSADASTTPRQLPHTRGTSSRDGYSR